MGLLNLFDHHSRLIIKKQLDDKNKHLWNEISNYFKIQVVNWKRGDYAAEVQDKNVTLFVSATNINPALFTHELLHLKLRKENVFFALYIYYCCENQYILSDILNLQNSALIGNLLDHIFMYKEYIEMGYAEENFAFDYGTNKFTQEEETMLSTGFSENVIETGIIGYYITKYIALRALKESGKDYNYAYTILRRIDSELYEILEIMMNKFLSLSGEEHKVVNEQYTGIVSNFLTDLEAWTREKIII